MAKIFSIGLSYIFSWPFNFYLSEVVKIDVGPSAPPIICTSPSLVIFFHSSSEIFLLINFSIWVFVNPWSSFAIVLFVKKPAKNDRQTRRIIKPFFKISPPHGILTLVIFLNLWTKLTIFHTFSCLIFSLWIYAVALFVSSVNFYFPLKKRKTFKSSPNLFIY